MQAEAFSTLQNTICCTAALIVLKFISEYVVALQNFVYSLFSSSTYEPTLKCNGKKQYCYLEKQQSKSNKFVIYNFNPCHC